MTVRPPEGSIRSIHDPYHTWVELSFFLERIDAFDLLSRLPSVSRIAYHPAARIVTTRSREDETRNARRNASRNP